MEMPAELAEREALRDECLAALRKWIPMLDKPTRDQLRQHADRVRRAAELQIGERWRLAFVSRTIGLQ